MCRRRHLLLLAADSVGDSLASVGEALLSRLKHGAALLLGRVATGAGGVSSLLGG
jgi:hypothetical protein